MGRDEDVFWKLVASVILRGIGRLGMGASLFLLDCYSLRSYEMAMFYRGLFKVWSIFKWKRIYPTSSLFWLLEELLVFGARLDMYGATGIAFSNRLLEARVVKLGQIVEVAGPGLRNTEAAASLIGLKSS